MHGFACLIGCCFNQANSQLSVSKIDKTCWKERVDSRYEKINEWADFLNLSKWFGWTNFENVPKDYGCTLD